MNHPSVADCVFCRIVAGQLPCFKLLEDDVSIGFMDINPAAEGHCLAVAKGHWPTVTTIPAEIVGRVAATARRLAIAVETVLTPDGINLIQANGRGAAQSVPHFHIHIMPRTIGDGLVLDWPVRAGERARIEAVQRRLLAALG